MSYEIPELANVSLRVYDMSGREVAELVNQMQQPGSYDVIFNASSLSSGVYFYKLEAGRFVQTKKMILIK
ncbi:MAG: T9SS type A sorting domain-containing protein [Ignavibacteria bacterium]|nr:T9SS type A sorting domain-containing protein [Ignavibacteria bacterium]